MWLMVKADEAKIKELNAQLEQDGVQTFTGLREIEMQVELMEVSHKIAENKRAARTMMMEWLVGSNLKPDEDVQIKMEGKRLSHSEEWKLKKVEMLNKELQESLLNKFEIISLGEHAETLYESIHPDVLGMKDTFTLKKQQFDNSLQKTDWVEPHPEINFDSIVFGKNLKKQTNDKYYVWTEYLPEIYFLEMVPLIDNTEQKEPIMVSINRDTGLVKLHSLEQVSAELIIEIMEGIEKTVAEGKLKALFQN